MMAVIELFFITINSTRSRQLMIKLTLWLVSNTDVLYQRYLRQPNGEHCNFADLQFWWTSQCPLIIYLRSTANQDPHSSKQSSIASGKYSGAIHSMYPRIIIVSFPIMQIPQNGLNLFILHPFILRTISPVSALLVFPYNMFLFMLDSFALPHLMEILIARSCSHANIWPRCSQID